MRRLGEANTEPSRSWVRGNYYFIRYPLTLTLSP